MSLYGPSHVLLAMQILLVIRRRSNSVGIADTWSSLHHPLTGDMPQQQNTRHDIEILDPECAINKTINMHKGRNARSLLPCIWRGAKAVTGGRSLHWSEEGQKFLQQWASQERVAINTPKAIAEVLGGWWLNELNAQWARIEAPPHTFSVHRGRRTTTEPHVTVNVEGTSYHIYYATSVFAGELRITWITHKDGGTTVYGQRI